MKKFTVILIGAGNRGEVYTDVMAQLPEKFQVIGVADALENRRKNIQRKHNIPNERAYASWEEILGQPKFADIVIIATQDNLHFAPAMKAMELGYDVLLEKPVSTTAEQCIALWQQSKKYGCKCMVCHVLRYTPFYAKVKQLLDADTIGEVVTIVHTEAVGNVHQSHSYVRGNWGNTSRSSCMLLAKSCHDMDLLPWLMNKKCKRIQSFGSLYHFCAKNAPADAPERCIDGCPHGDTCYYNAVKLYLDNKKNAWFRTTSTGKVDPTDADVEWALRNTQYGKCVYKCDNDAVDHQVVNMEFEDGATASFTMSAFNYDGRKSNIMGTKGEMFLDFNADEIKLLRFSDRQFEIIHPGEDPVAGTVLGGHGGGDPGTVLALYDYMTGVRTAGQVSEIGVSCENHLLVFAAEQSRLTGKIVDIQPLE